MCTMCLRTTHYVVNLKTENFQTYRAKGGIEMTSILRLRSQLIEFTALKKSIVGNRTSGLLRKSANFKRRQWSPKKNTLATKCSALLKSKVSLNKLFKNKFFICFEILIIQVLMWYVKIHSYSFLTKTFFLFKIKGLHERLTIWPP